MPVKRYKLDARDLTSLSKCEASQYRRDEVVRPLFCRHLNIYAGCSLILDRGIAIHPFADSGEERSHSLVSSSSEQLFQQVQVWCPELYAHIEHIKQGYIVSYAILDVVFFR